MNTKILKSKNPNLKNENKGKVTTAPSEAIFLGITGLIILGPNILDETIGYQSEILKIQEYILKNPQMLVKGGSIMLVAMTACIFLDALRYFIANK